MSGLFLIVEEKNKKPVLKRTVGGYPHVTLFYSGDKVESRTLIKVGSKTLQQFYPPPGEFGFSDTFTLLTENAKIHSFHKESTGLTRYDVLLHLYKDDNETIKALRNNAVSMVGNDVSMQDPHVTYSTHWTKEEAEASLAHVKRLLPVQVKVTGITID